MKSKIITAIIGILLIGAASVSAQGVFDTIKKTKERIDKAKEQTKQTGNETLNRGEADNREVSADRNKYPHFARFEVNVNWTERGKKVYETRVYYSNLIGFENATGYRDDKGAVIEYFNQGIVEQLKQRGFEVNFYDNQVQVFPKNFNYDSSADAQADMDKKIEVDKSNERAIYTFIWKYGAKNVSEEITQPKRIFGVKNPPAKEFENIAVNTTGREAKAQSAQNAKVEAEMTQKQKLIWGYAIIRATVKKRNGQETGRTYVSEIAPVSRADYNAFYNRKDFSVIQQRILDYFEATVVLAAKHRGEEITVVYLNDIEYKFNVELSGKHLSAGEDYAFLPKSAMEEPRQRWIDLEKESGRQAYIFRWDTSGKNISVDFERESKRGNSADLPN